MTHTWQKLSRTAILCSHASSGREAVGQPVSLCAIVLIGYSAELTNIFAIKILYYCTQWSI